MPVIMLTARGEETDRIVGLEMGADDYLPKPFSPRELLARIKSRAAARPQPAAQPAARGGARRSASPAGRSTRRRGTWCRPTAWSTPLGGAEYQLLRHLPRAIPNRVLTATS